MVSVSLGTVYVILARNYHLVKSCRSLIDKATLKGSFISGLTP